MYPLPEHDVITTPQPGWAGITNGDLLQRASKDFDVFVTVDRNLAFQQNPSNLPLPVIVIHARSNKLRDIQQHFPALQQTLSSESMNKFIEGLDRQFAQLHRDSHKLIEVISPELLYHQPPGRSNSLPLHSCGEHLLRSAAVVEQTFGGITTNLWDDPFEWTLPETLPTPDKVSGYLDEVEATRKHGFQLLKSDMDLVKEIMAPSGSTQLLPLLLDTLARAAHHQGRSWATFEILRAAKRD